MNDYQEPRKHGPAEIYDYCAEAESAIHRAHRDQVY